MRQLTYDEIKHRKNFYRNCFRKTSTLLILSTLFNILLALGVFFKLITTPLPDFYATNGAANPMKIKNLDEANQSSKPLLEDDPVEEVNEKELPVGS